MQSQRHRAVTYGKAPRRPESTFVGNLASPERSRSLKSIPTTPSGALKRVRRSRSPTPHDAGVFDVPLSDDDEDISTPAKKLSRPSKPSSKPVPRPASPGQQLTSPHPPRPKPLPRTAIRQETRKKSPAKQLPRKHTASEYTAAENDIRQRDVATPSPASPQLPRSSRSSSHVTIQSPKSVNRREQADNLSTPKPLRDTWRERSVTPLTTPPLQRQFSNAMTPEPLEPIGTPLSHGKATLTPKQSQLWKDFLGDDQPSSPPSSMKKDDFVSLSIHTAHKPEPMNGIRRGLPRRKLVDALSKESSQDENEKSRYDMSSDDDEDRTKDLGPIHLPLHHPLEQAPAALNDRGATITYASQRSYLAEPEEDFEASLQRPLELDSGFPSQSSSSKANLAAWQQESDEELATGGMKNIHELRASGDDRRFRDEIELLLEDLGPDLPISRKRSAILELASRLEDADFRIRFVEGGHETMALRSCSVETDPIFATAATTVILLVLAQATSSRSVVDIYDAGALSMLARLLTIDRPLNAIAKDRRSNMSKIAIESVKEFSDTLKKSSTWPYEQETQVTPSLLAIHCVDVLLRRLKETGVSVSSFDEKFLHDLLHCIPTSSDNTDSSPPSAVDVTLQDIVFSVLDSATSMPNATLDSKAFSTADLEQLADALSDSLDKTPSQQRKAVALRLTLNITNNNDSHWYSFASSRLVSWLVETALADFQGLALKMDEPDAESTVDELVLALGAMTNLAEWDERTPAAVLGFAPGSLESLSSVFAKSRKTSSAADSMAGTQSNVAFGYLAVLLGKLCSSKAARTRITSALPQGNVHVVREAIEEFISFHKKVDMEMAAQQGIDDYVSPLSQRLQSVADGLRRFE